MRCPVPIEGRGAVRGSGLAQGRRDSCEAMQDARGVSMTRVQRSSKPSALGRLSRKRCQPSAPRSSRSTKSVRPSPRTLSEAATHTTYEHGLERMLSHLLELYRSCEARGGPNAPVYEVAEYRRFREQVRRGLQG